MELVVLQALKFRINPITINNWAQIFLGEWDNYFMMSLENELNSFEVCLTFKQPNESSYQYYREIMQFIDVVQLDIETLQYSQRSILAAIMYLIVGKNLNQYNINQIVQQFPINPIFMGENNQSFNEYFENFLKNSFGFYLEDLVQAIQYTASFFHLVLNFELPVAAKVNKENVLLVIREIRLRRRRQTGVAT